MTDRVSAVKSKLRDWLEIVATMASIVLCVTVTWALVARRSEPPPRADAPPSPGRPAPSPLPPEPISIETGTKLGDPSAKVVLIEYTEFKCPYCGTFARDTLPNLKRAYVDTGKVLFVLRHFPLDALHPFARQAAAGAECAGGDGKFWELHDLMFANQRALDHTSLTNHAKALGFDQNRFEACLTGAAARRVEADVATGESLGVTGTPTMFVGLRQDANTVKLVQRLVGAQKFDAMQAALDKWLGEAEKSVTK